MRNLQNFAILLWVLLLFTDVQAQDNWISLSKGRDLKSWKQLGGVAEYKVIDGVIIGTTKSNTANSFLCTKQNYSDFILELEMWVDPAVNSGIQIRSNSLQDYKNGRVHGYQVETDPSPRAFSGGIYDEGRRGWLYPLSRNTTAQKALKNGVWNKYHIEAIGNTISTWINGIQCTKLVDDMTSEGFIGLQVHSINDPDLVGREVKWRNIKILTNNLEGNRWVQDPKVPQISYLVNQLTDYEKRLGWRLLWDGKTSAGWRGAKLDGFPDKGWEIKDGVLTILGSEGKEAAGPGDIITTYQFGEFELELEFKITKGANSGIKYFVDPELNKGPGSAIGCEYQILDDDNHPDAKEGVNGNRTIGSLYDLISAENLSVPGREKQFRGIDQWNHARVVVKGNQVEHWLNQEKVVEYDRQSQMFRALVAYSKYSKWPGFGQWQQGHILLQDHGSTVHFRSIKIREY